MGEKCHSHFADSKTEVPGNLMTDQETEAQDLNPGLPISRSHAFNHTASFWPRFFSSVSLLCP